MIITNYTKSKSNSIPIKDSTLSISKTPFHKLSNNKNQAKAQNYHNSAVHNSKYATSMNKIIPSLTVIRPYPILHNNQKL